MIAAGYDLKRMLNNDKRLTSLILHFSSDHLNMKEQIVDLKAALESNTVITNVMISADDSFGSGSSSSSSAGIQNDLMMNFEAVARLVGRLPNLQVLTLSSFCQGRGRGILPVRLISPLLKETKQLTSLVIDDLTLTGTQTDFDQLAQEVQKLWYLERFTLNGVLISSTPSTGQPFALDSLLLSLSVLPSLKCLTLIASKDQQKQNECFSLSAFSALFISSSIHTLQIHHWTLPSDHLTGMAKLLQGNTTLQALGLGPLPDVTPQVAKSLGTMLQRNTGVIHLELILSKMFCDKSAQILAGALRSRSDNTSSLQTLILSGQRLGRISKRCRSAFLSMIQNNHSLKSVFLFRKTFLQDQLAFYTRLNAMGRRSMLRLTNSNSKSNRTPKPEEVWVQAMAHPAINQDLNSIYYFLSNNPQICDHQVRGSDGVGVVGVPDQKKDNNDQAAESTTKNLKRRTEASKSTVSPNKRQRRL